MKNVTLGMLLLAAVGFAPLAGCVVHDREREIHDRPVVEERRDVPHYEHHDDVRHDDVHVDVHP